MRKGTKALPYEWMVKYTPQEAWISGKGICLWLAWFFTEACSGMYLVSLFVGLEAGLFAGWFGALILGGFFHLIYLGKMGRGWRILLKISNSELSRGLWVTFLFGAVGFLQLLPIVFPNLPWDWNNTGLVVLMTIICVFAVIHGFLTMSVIRALPMWNSPVMIPLSLASGLWVGSQAVLLIMSLQGGEVASAEVWVRWSLFFVMGSLLIYLWGCVHSSETAKASVMRLLAGDLSALFYGGAIAIGILIPLIITLIAWDSGLASVGQGLLFLRFICAIIGDALMRYGIMRAPLYAPLI